MTENEANIYSIAYRDCKEVAESIDVNEECGKANTILFYMDEILDALKIASELQAIGTIEEFKDLKEKNEPKRLLTREEKYPQNYGMYSTSDRWCPCCRGLVFTGDWSVHKQNIMYKRIRCGCGQKLDWSE